MPRGNFSLRPLNQASAHSVVSPSNQAFKKAAPL
ncbi:MAG: hypothetical protein ACI9NQ_001214 [Paracoccaceae bacterium]|jgi:hypothetical protein